LMLHDDEISEIRVPEMQSVDTHGAGDSLTAGVAATLADGGSMREAVVLGTAAGALNVTRHGLGTGEEGAIRNLTKLVTVSTHRAGEPAADQQASPDELARKVWTQ
ncbi:MAG TPA: PfkB family carbohydrate kinase, partial [Arthrobacter sp.]|nr:PfkB family carbohydrate kinase [Arthrobacter sp.]